MDILLHPTTKIELEHFIQRPGQAMLIVGPEGTGKRTIANYLASELLQIENLDKYPHFRLLEPDGQSISIEAVRELINFTKLKIPSAGVRRIIFIDQAHTMTIEAQNALLKLLEEPPEGTLFLLSVTNLQDLLPTVRSRVQQLVVRHPSTQELEQYFTTLGFDSQKIHSAMLMSGGLLGLTHALLDEDSEHPLTQAVEQARKILKATTHERLTMIDELAKQKGDCMRILFILQQMAHAAIQQTNRGTLRRWQNVLKVTYRASEELAYSGQPKLVLTNLMLNL